LLHKLIGMFLGSAFLLFLCSHKVARKPHPAQHERKYNDQQARKSWLSAGPLRHAFDPTDGPGLDRFVSTEPSQFIGQLTCGTVPRIGVGRKTLVADRDKVARQS
jgi:hypothetical protein